jgi:hypothetical protein
MQASKSARQQASRRARQQLSNTARERDVDTESATRQNRESETKEHGSSCRIRFEEAAVQPCPDHTYQRAGRINRHEGRPTEGPCECRPCLSSRAAAMQKPAGAPLLMTHHLSVTRVHPSSPLPRHAGANGRNARKAGRRASTHLNADAARKAAVGAARKTASAAQRTQGHQKGAAAARGTQTLAKSRWIGCGKVSALWQANVT